MRSIVNEDLVSNTLVSSGNKRSGKEVFGTLVPKKLNAVALRFKGAPVWILGLYPVKVEVIYIPDFSSFSDLLQHIESCNVETGEKDLLLDNKICNLHCG